MPGAAEARVELEPAWPVRLPRGGMDGLARRRDGIYERLVHDDAGTAVHVRVAVAGARVVIGARSPDEAAAAWGVGRMRFVLGVDENLRAFHARYADDPLIGASVRARPWLRPPRRPRPFEVLAWAVCEQLIQFERATAIERRITRRWGRRCAHTGLRDAPDAAALAGAAPAELQACDLAEGRALALVRVAREVASRRVDLDAPDHERARARLQRIAGIGSWTLDVLATSGQGRYDRIPAGDLAYRKLVGRLHAGGDPRARADEDEVRAFFASYGEWQALAGLHALHAAGAVPTALAA